MANFRPLSRRQPHSLNVLITSFLPDCHGTLIVVSLSPVKGLLDLNREPPDSDYNSLTQLALLPTRSLSQGFNALGNFKRYTFSVTCNVL